MKQFLKSLLISLPTFGSVNLYAQKQGQAAIDSLQNELKKIETQKEKLSSKSVSSADSTKANILVRIGEMYWETKPDTAMAYAQQALMLSEQIGYKRGACRAYNIMGVVNDLKSNFTLSAAYFQKAIKKYEETGYKNGGASAYNNLGMMYVDAGNYNEAIKSYFAAIQLYDETGDKKHAGAVYKVIGNLYKEQFSDFDAALKCYQKALNIEEETGDKKSVADSYQEMGEIYHYWLDDYNIAMEYYQNALEIYEKTSDRNGIASVHFNIGNNYLSQGNYPAALKNGLLALKKYEEIEHDHPDTKRGIALSYEVISQVNSAQLNYAEALKNSQNALMIFQALHDTDHIVFDLGIIGKIYFSQLNYTAALDAYLRSLTLAEKVNNKKVIGLSYYHIGEVYEKQEMYPEALKNILKSITLFEETLDKRYLVMAEIVSGAVYEKLGDQHEALKHESLGLSLSLKMGDKAEIKDAYEELAKVNANLQNYKAAYENEVLFKNYYDTIYNKENEKKLTGLQMQYDFDKKQDSIKTEQVKKDAVAKKEIQNQKNIRNYSLASVLLLLGFSFFIVKERRKSEKLLLNILPSEVARELKKNGSAAAKQFDNVTVLFTDFVSFTKVSMRLSPQELVNELDACFKAFDHIMGKYNIEKIKTVGDAYLAVCGLPKADPDHAGNVVTAAIEISAFMIKRKKELGDQTFGIRLGVHSGNVVAGIVGVKKFAYDIWGDTVNTAARMEQNSEAGRINISETTYELVKDKFTCEYRGEIDAKNKGMLKMYFVS